LDSSGQYNQAPLPVVSQRHLLRATRAEPEELYPPHRFARFFENFLFWTTLLYGYFHLV
jgi:hypothetical protein